MFAPHHRHGDLWKNPNVYLDDFSSLEAGWSGAGFAVGSGVATITPTEGSNRVTNGDMETWGSATDLTGWTEQITGGTVNRESTSVHGGSFAVRYDRDGSSNLARVYRASSMPTNTWHILRYWARGSDTVPFSAFPGTALGLNHNPARALTTSYQEFLANGRSTVVNGDLFPDSTNSQNKSVYYDDISDFDLTLATLFALRATAFSNVVTARATPSVVLGTFAGMAICVNDPTTPTSFIAGYINRNAAFLVELSGGVYTQHIDNAAITYVGGAPLEIRKNGTTVSLWYNGAQVSTDKTVTATNATYHGLFSGYGGNSFNDFLLQGA